MDLSDSIIQDHTEQRQDRLLFTLKAQSLISKRLGLSLGPDFLPSLQLTALRRTGICFTPAERVALNQELHSFSMK